MTGKLLTIGEVVMRAAEYLARHGVETARLDAELLIGHALGLTRLQVYLERDRPMTEAERERARELVRRRAAREPVAYILGKREFRSREFEVTPAVLIPRPETELLVEHALTELERHFGRGQPLRVLEFGVGCGAIAVSLAAEMPEVEVVATEASPAAAEVARRNAERHGVADRVEVRVQPDFEGIAGPFHALVSNPPYVAESEAATLPPDVVRYEPHQALFGGPDGMRWIEWLMDEGPKRLVAGGFMLFEIGSTQGELVRRAAAVRGLTLEAILPDYAGLPRLARLSLSTAPGRTVTQPNCLPEPPL